MATVSRRCGPSSPTAITSSALHGEAIVAAPRRTHRAHPRGPTHVPVVVLTSRREIAHWLRGPLAIAVANGGSPG
jgi:hypothetical protein